MKRFVFLLTALLLANLNMPGQIKVASLLCENRVNPVGLGNPKLRLSWMLESPQRNVMQSAYEVRVAADRAS